ncbi:hypothetical protein [uncultured Sphingobacterium sp.]|jgi:hypothetical protein|uniref:hypothetical protein n=1 Tax=uncultured Sphingobacterium sp. TaxID=182688 RepID=UPI003748DD2D
MPAIIEFLGGEKAYAKIIHALPSEITITVGEHSTDKGEKSLKKPGYFNRIKKRTIGKKVIC